jgi:(p)ppGpp synthase/HD superfamily hydrolase
MTFERAVEAATKAHAGQKRKYTGEDYVVHPKAVAKNAIDMGLDEHVVAAAYLHDADEDTSYKIADIRRDFGDKVADLVAWLTNPSKGSKASRAERKAMDRAHIEKAPDEAKILKGLDRLDNLLGMKGADDDFKKLYAKESILLADSITKNAQSPLVFVLSEAVRMEAEDLLEDAND